MRNHIRVAPALLVLGLALGTAPPALAQEPGLNGAVDFTPLLPAVLTIFLPLGLILLISSALPEADAPATAVNLVMVWAVAALAYFAVGFAFQFGGIAQVTARPDLSGLYWEWYPLDQSVDVTVARLWGVVALRGWALSGEAATAGALRLFLSHLSLAGLAAMIPVAAIPAPLRRPAALLVGLVTGSLIYPIAGNWVWGGGWLASLGLSLGLGHGLVDFGGGGLLFLTGSVVTLLALILLKSPPEPDAPPEPAQIVVITGQEYDLSVYDDQPEAVADEVQLLAATPMPSAYLPILSLVGAGLMLVGWFGLAAGAHSPTALNFSPAQAAAGGALAALSGALAAGAYSWFTTAGLNPLMVSRGFVAGLVLALPGAPFVPIWLLVVAGLLVGLFLPPLIYLFNQGSGLADELGVVATHGVSALAGLLLVALFATGQAGQGWNGVGLTDYRGVAGQGVSGLVAAPGYVSDWPGQFQAQLLGMGAVILWALVVAFLLFQTVKVVAASWARSGLELAGPTISGPGAGTVAGSPANPALSAESGLESGPDGEDEPEAAQLD